MQKNLLDSFSPFTVGYNSGFKLNFDGIVVSVVCHNAIDAVEEMADSKNGMVGRNLDELRQHSETGLFDTDVRTLSFVTFSHADVMVFVDKSTCEPILKKFLGDRYDDEFITDMFVSDDLTYDEESKCCYVNSAFDLFEILFRISRFYVKAAREENTNV